MKTVKVVEKVKHRCSQCDDRSLVRCPNCSGRGHVNLYQGMSWLLSYQLCYFCCGEGEVPCPHCALEAVRG